MSIAKDALSALQNVILMQSEIENLRRDVGQLTEGLSGLKDFTHALDKRIIRIETMIEMSAARGTQPPRLEGN